MLKLIVTTKDDYNKETREFETSKVTIELEHSLASMSKWEEIWEIPLLSTHDKTDEQVLSYIECMCMTPDVSPEVFQQLKQDDVDRIMAYMDSNHTATWFAEETVAKSSTIVTAELIYYWMTSFSIDWQAQYWHLNRLLTLLKVFDAKQSEGNKKPRRRSNAQMQDIARLNAQRRAELGTNG